MKKPTQMKMTLRDGTVYVRTSVDAAGLEHWCSEKHAADRRRMGIPPNTMGFRPGTSVEYMRECFEDFERFSADWERNRVTRTPEQMSAERDRLFAELESLGGTVTVRAGQDPGRARTHGAAALMRDPNHCQHGREWWACESCLKRKGEYLERLCEQTVSEFWGDGLLSRINVLQQQLAALLTEIAAPPREDR